MTYERSAKEVLNNCRGSGEELPMKVLMISNFAFRQQRSKLSVI
jgi:hypothetical protein